jgi:hypothetical protein
MNNMLTPEERGKKGFAALAGKYGKRTAWLIIHRAQTDKVGGSTYGGIAAEKRDYNRSIEAMARKIYGKAY